MKVVIPMAGFGKRLRPLTYSRPKPLVNIAGHPMLKHVIDSLEGIDIDEYIFIVGYLGDQIQEYINANYDIKATFIEQKEMIGQSHAIYLAREHLQGPVIVLFADTLFEANVRAINTATNDGVIYVKEVDDPRSFGVVRLDEQGYITSFIEKPPTMDNKLAVIGLYYVRESEKLLAAIEKQMAQNIARNGEYFIADAFQIMINEGARLSTEQVGVWLDCGKPDALLETNQYLLRHNADNSTDIHNDTVMIIPPVYIHPSARIEHAIIGPYTTISADCEIRDSIIRDSIVDSSAVVTNTILVQSLIGRDARVVGRYRTLNISDTSTLIE
ncbi:MAG: NTP transferase domain-containing protein [Anaerolineae bacterium]|nr:NTP transferase domain-containing protein [Anaerolineae bacterium]